MKASDDIPQGGVYYADGKPALNPPEGPHEFCAGSYRVVKDGIVQREYVAAATQTGFREVLK